MDARLTTLSGRRQLAYAAARGKRFFTASRLLVPPTTTQMGNFALVTSLTTGSDEVKICIRQSSLL